MLECLRTCRICAGRLQLGKKLWPYHLDHANEEWLVVLRGRPTLRTPEGERELVEGDVACFPRGAAGAHLVRNATEEPVRILMLSTLIAPESPLTVAHVAGARHRGSSTEERAPA